MVTATSQSHCQSFPLSCPAESVTTGMAVQCTDCMLHAAAVPDFSPNCPFLAGALQLGSAPRIMPFACDLPQRQLLLKQHSMTRSAALLPCLVPQTSGAPACLRALYLASPCIARSLQARCSSTLPLTRPWMASCRRCRQRGRSPRYDSDLLCVAVSRAGMRSGRGRKGGGGPSALLLRPLWLQYPAFLRRLKSTLRLAPSCDCDFNLKSRKYTASSFHSSPVGNLPPPPLPLPSCPLLHYFFRRSKLEHLPHQLSSFPEGSGATCCQEL